MKILQIHSSKMNVDLSSVNFEELARSTEDFNGAMLKAVCVEAGMIALRRDATAITHEDFMAGIAEVSRLRHAAARRSRMPLSPTRRCKRRRKWTYSTTLSLLSYSYLLFLLHLLFSVVFF